MELSYAGKKLKKKKRSLIFSVYFFDFLVILGMTIIFSILKILQIKNIIHVSGNIFIKIGVILVFSIVTGILTMTMHLIMLNVTNTRYEKFYMKLLQDEAMLEGLTIFPSCDNISDVDYSVLAKYNGLEKINVDQVITQTSSTAFFDLICFHYENKQFGVIIKMKIDFRFSELVQIRNDGRRGVFEYNDKPVKQYGTGQTSDIKEFAIYSTMNTEIYNLFKEGSLEDLYELSSFAKAPIVLTVIEDNLFIFIDGWNFNLKRSLHKKDSLSIIDVQIEALKMLQNYVEKITMLVNQA